MNIISFEKNKRDRRWKELNSYESNIKKICVDDYFPIFVKNALMYLHIHNMKINNILKTNQISNTIYHNDTRNSNCDIMDTKHVEKISY